MCWRDKCLLRQGTNQQSHKGRSGAKEKSRGRTCRASSPCGGNSHKWCHREGETKLHHRYQGIFDCGACIRPSWKTIHTREYSRVSLQEHLPIGSGQAGLGHCSFRYPRWDWDKQAWVTHTEICSCEITKPGARQDHILQVPTAGY